MLAIHPTSRFTHVVLSAPFAAAWAKLWSPALDPGMDDPRILSCRNVRLRPEARSCSFLASTGFGSRLGSARWFRTGPAGPSSSEWLWRGSQARPLALTSSTCNRTRSQPVSLLSMARFNRARPRARCSSWSRIRIAQTSFGFSGRFCPMRRPLFRGTFCMIASIEPTATSPASADGRTRKSTLSRRSRNQTG